MQRYDLIQDAAGSQMKRADYGDWCDWDDVNKLLATLAEKSAECEALADRIGAMKGELCNDEPRDCGEYALRILGGEDPLAVIREAMSSYKGFYNLSCEFREADQRELRKLEAAVRKHRDQRGDDRCWMDDEELYKALPEGFTPPERDTTVELEHCKRYIECRRNPATVYVSPEREIETLSNQLAAAIQEREAVHEAMSKHVAARDKIIADLQAELKSLRKTPSQILGVEQ